MREFKFKKRKLLYRILFILVVPLIVIVIMASMSIRTVGIKMADKLTHSQLKSSFVGFQATLEAASPGEYRIEGEHLWKGAMDLTQVPIALDMYKQEAEIDVTLFVDDTRYATSVMDDNNNRILFTKMSPMAYNALKKSDEFFSDNVDVNGKKYYGYYKELQKMGDHSIIMFAGKDAEEIHQIYAQILIGNIASIVVLSILVSVMIALIIRKIVKIIMESSNNLDQLAAGELNSSIGEKILNRGDELGNIARAIYSLIYKLKEIILQIHESSDNIKDFSQKLTGNFEYVNQSIENVNGAVDEIATGATNLADETQNVTEQMIIMGQSVSTTGDSVERLTSNTEDMKRQNKEAANTLDQLIRISDATAKSVESVHEQTNMTNQSVQDISSAIDIISDIAAQTNLLSLNASIEAARAGEHGKGFAVVAEEVRKLADQSQESVAKIEGIVEELIRNSNTSVSIMDEVLQAMNEQGEKLNDTKGVFQSLNQNISQVVSEIENISVEINAIDQAKDSVLEKLENLAAISEENAASTQETAATMGEVGRVIKDCADSVEDLKALSDRLEEQVSNFTIPEQESES